MNKYLFVPCSHIRAKKNIFYVYGNYDVFVAFWLVCMGVCVRVCAKGRKNSCKKLVHKLFSINLSLKK